MKVLYEDNHLLVVEKPVNMPVQADSSGDTDLLTACKAYIKQKYNKPGDVYLGLVHRLDRPAGGVTVFARTSKAASRLTAQFASHAADKRYAALVTGAPHAGAKLSGFILRDEAAGGATAVPANTPGAKSAVLSYQRLTAHGGLTLAAISLLTGRHHQIRCQMADAGLALYGDQRYNKNAVPGEQLALWAYSLTVEHPTLHERMTFVSMPQGRAWEPFNTELRALLAGVKLVYADANILCCNKDAGMSVAAADGGDALEERLAGALGGEIYPVHRLDVATEGLVLFARTAAARDALEDAIKTRAVKKYYRCEVYGQPPADEAELRAWLVKDAEGARVEVLDAARPGAKEIITRYRVLERRAETALLEVELVTGRTHQIRAHLAHAGLPLVGDDRYGARERDRASGARALALRAVRIGFSFPQESALYYLSGKTISIED